MITKEPLDTGEMKAAEVELTGTSEVTLGWAWLRLPARSESDLRLKIGPALSRVCAEALNTLAQRRGRMLAKRSSSLDSLSAAAKVWILYMAWQKHIKSIKVGKVRLPPDT